MEEFFIFLLEKAPSILNRREAENFAVILDHIDRIYIFNMHAFFYTLNKSCTQMKHFFISVICISSTFQTEI